MIMDEGSWLDELREEEWYWIETRDEGTCVRFRGLIGLEGDLALAFDGYRSNDPVCRDPSACILPIEICGPRGCEMARTGKMQRGLEIAIKSITAIRLMP
jgi:hypothetical protein